MDMLWIRNWDFAEPKRKDKMTSSSTLINKFYRKIKNVGCKIFASRNCSCVKTIRFNVGCTNGRRGIASNKERLCTRLKYYYKASLASHSCTFRTIFIIGPSRVSYPSVVRVQGHGVLIGWGWYHRALYNLAAHQTKRGDRNGKRNKNFDSINFSWHLCSRIESKYFQQTNFFWLIHYYNFIFMLDG